MTNIEKEIYVNLIKNGLVMIDEKLKDRDESLNELPYGSINYLSTIASKSPYLDKGILTSTILDLISYSVGRDAALEVIDEVTKRGIIPVACPYKGEFIGYKKCRDKFSSDVIVTLKIPAHAKRSSSLSKKCRCSEAIVADIRMIIYDIIPIKPINIAHDDPIWTFPNGCNIPGYNNPLIKTNPRIDETTSHNIDKAYSGRSGYPFNLGDKLVYRLGETVKPDSFDPNRFNECSHGIHFFMTEQEALDYCL